MSYQTPQGIAPMTPATAAAHTPIYAAQGLTEGGRVAHIQLGDQIYTLRITKAEKLILTK